MTVPSKPAYSYQIEIIKKPLTLTRFGETKINVFWTHEENLHVKPHNIVWMMCLNHEHPYPLLIRSFQVQRGSNRRCIGYNQRRQHMPVIQSLWHRVTSLFLPIVAVYGKIEFIYWKRSSLFQSLRFCSIIRTVEMIGIAANLASQ